ncbi:MAG: hypothetical protein AAF245_15085, partial [Pseudomonadota bacterium]
ADPKTNPQARFFPRITYDEVLTRNLKVMDASAIALARENSLPIIVFSLNAPGGLAGVVAGEGTYTVVGAEQTELQAAAPAGA